MNFEVTGSPSGMVIIICRTQNNECVWWTGVMNDVFYCVLGEARGLAELTGGQVHGI